MRNYKPQSDYLSAGLYLSPGCYIRFGQRLPFMGLPAGLGLYRPPPVIALSPGVSNWRFSTYHGSYSPRSYSSQSSSRCDESGLSDAAETLILAQHFTQLARYSSNSINDHIIKVCNGDEEGKCTGKNNEGKIVEIAPGRWYCPWQCCGP